MTVRVQSLARLRHDRRGAALTEFGLVAPVLCVAMLGAFDIGHSLYMRSVLQGQIQKAARDSTLESAKSIDDKTKKTKFDGFDEVVKAQVLAMNKNAEIDVKREYYRTFSSAKEATAEPYTDVNKNKKCDKGEPFDDLNGNGKRDLTGANDYEDSGAKDVVVYTVNVKYPRMFPMAKFIGVSPDVEYEAKTVLANQPYGDQNMKVGNCT